MIGIKIRVCDLLMAPATLVHDVQLESLFVRALNRMRRVAVAAHRHLLVGLSCFCGVDTPRKLFFNPVVATAAGDGDIARVHAGSGVALRQNAMRSVATGTGRRDGQPALHQPPAVNALRVPLDDLVLASLFSDVVLYEFEFIWFL